LANFEGIRGGKANITFVGRRLKKGNKGLEMPRKYYGRAIKTDGGSKSGE